MMYILSKSFARNVPKSSVNKNAIQPQLVVSDKYFLLRNNKIISKQKKKDKENEKAT